MLKKSKACGYLIITLHKNSKCRTASIHRLLAIQFIPNPNNLEEVNHIDDNKLNNNLINLEWCTPSDNQQHAVKTSLHHNKSIKMEI